jgi:HK97 family phage major capsid protein
MVVYNKWLTAVKPTIAINWDLTKKSGLIDGVKAVSSSLVPVLDASGTAVYPLIYGDFSQGYEVTRHTEMYLIDDIYTGAAEFVRNLHIMARFGGNVIKSEALVQLSITAS